MSCPSVGSDGLYSLCWLPHLTMLDLSYTFLTNLVPVFKSCLHLKVCRCTCICSQTCITASYVEHDFLGISSLDFLVNSACSFNEESYGRSLRNFNGMLFAVWVVSSSACNIVTSFYDTIWNEVFFDQSFVSLTFYHEYFDYQCHFDSVCMSIRMLKLFSYWGSLGIIHLWFEVY